MQTTSNLHENNLDTRITLFGKDCLSPSAVTIKSLNDRMAIGISAGNTDHNEDAVGAVTIGQRTVLVVADGHWGDAASYLAVTEAIRLLGKTGAPHGNEPIGWLYSLFERINKALLASALQDEPLEAPETALLVAHIGSYGNARVHWASFGDAFLYHFSFSPDEKAEQLNTLRSTWLGALSALAGDTRDGHLVIPYPGQKQPDGYQNIANGLEVGMVDLQSNDILILATDGLPQCQVYNTTSLLPSDLHRAIAGLDTTQIQCKALIDAALKLGGVDNIACAVYQNVSQ